MTPAQPPASEADVVEAGAKAIDPRAFVEGWERSDDQRIARRSASKALTAARDLGVLLPEEAAKLRDLVDDTKAMAYLDNRECITAQRERDALAARLARAEEALGKIAVSGGFVQCIAIATDALAEPYRCEECSDSGWECVGHASGPSLRYCSACGNPDRKPSP